MYTCLGLPVQGLQRLLLYKVETANFIVRLSKILGDLASLCSPPFTLIEWVNVSILYWFTFVP